MAMKARLCRAFFSVLNNDFWSRVIEQPIAGAVRLGVCDDALIAARVTDARQVIVGQPAFFTEVSNVLKQEPLGDIKTYLAWQLVSSVPSALYAVAETWLPAVVLPVWLPCPSSS